MKLDVLSMRARILTIESDVSIAEQFYQHEANVSSQKAQTLIQIRNRIRDEIGSSRSTILDHEE